VPPLDRHPSPLPTGTITFLRTDVEGSMGLTKALGVGWDAVNATHLALIREAVARHGGVVVRTEGDALFATFQEAGAAVRAAVDAQRGLAVHPWPDGTTVRVRMGLHSGEAHLAGDDYGGFEVNRAARVAAVGHGGQIVVSGPAYELTADALPTGVRATDLGAYVLKDVPRPERLYQLDVDGLPMAFPPLRAGRATRGNLTPRLTSFLGRERELDDVRRLAETSHLVSITGPGGIGKTSLAVEFARSVQGAYPDGAWFIPLATVEDPAAVAPLVARTLGLFDGAARSATDTLPDFIAGRAMLLVLDNYEHVMDAADVVADLVARSPASRVIVTSRAPLHLIGEQEYPLGPLPIGGADDAAGRLFVERAGAIRPGWDPGADAAVVDEICRLVDGLPLGVELAAARVGLLAPASIHDRLAARLTLPGVGARDAPGRQRTLEAAVAWSHDLLPAELQIRLHRLAVFEGGFDVAQAEIVTVDAPGVTGSDFLDELAQLHDQSLVARDASAAGVRFRLLRTIQTFAIARLTADGDEPSVRRRHALAYLALAEEAERHDGRAGSAEWLERLSADHANLRTAVAWAIEAGEADLALRLVAALWRYWQADGHLGEGRELTEQALAMPGADVPSTARMWALAAAGNMEYWRADADRARTYYRTQLDLARALQDEAGIVDATFNLGYVEFVGSGGTIVMHTTVDEVRARYRDLGDERGIAHADWAAANMLLGAGRAEDARAAFEELERRFDALDDARYKAMASGSLAWANFTLHDRGAAAMWAARALSQTFVQRDLGTTTIQLHFGVLIAVTSGRPEDAARLSGAFDANCERYGIRPPAALEMFVQTQDPFRMAREALPPERFELAYQAGRRLSLGEAVDLVIEIAGSGPPPIAR
jgi:predicted ATPase/class 3 adenylate cyclase